VLTDAPKSGGDLNDQRGTTRVAVRQRLGPVTLVVCHAVPAAQARCPPSDSHQITVRHSA